MDNDTPSRAFLLSTAERELGSFISAVTESYGSEQAEISAGEWLDELESMEGEAELTPRTLRQLTIAAAARLATRLTNPLDQTADGHARVISGEAEFRVVLTM